jgi:hypothetical protein
VTVFRRAFAAGSESERRGAESPARAVTPVLCSLGVAALLVATLCSAVAPAGAAAPGSLQDQAAALSRQMLLEQLQIGGFEQQRAADMKGLAADDALLQQLKTRLLEMQLRIGADRARLRGAAVRAYVEGGTQADGMNALFADTPSENASAVYAQVMNADLASSLARLQSDVQALHTEALVGQRVSAEARRQLSGADAALAAAESTQQRLAQQRTSVVGELAVAQQQALIAAREAATRASSVSNGQDVRASPASNVSTGPASALATASAPVTPATPATPATGALPPLNTFLSCVVQAESGGNYQAVSPTGLYMGAFQFAQQTWNVAAGLAGIPTLVGVPPYQASMRDQDLLAIALYNADGEQPWYDPCRY